MGKVVIWKEMRLGNGITADVAQVEQPHRAPSIESDYIVPTLQGATSGLLVGTGIAAALYWLAHVSLWPAWPISVAACMGLGYLLALSESRQTLWRTESMTVLGGQEPAPPAPEPKPHDILYNPDEARSEVADMLGEQAQADRFNQLVDFVRRCAAVGTGESAQGIKPSDRPQYLANRDVLLDLGLARWRKPDNKRLGWELTTAPAQAREVIRRHVIAGV